MTIKKYVWYTRHIFMCGIDEQHWHVTRILICSSYSFVCKLSNFDNHNTEKKTNDIIMQRISYTRILVCLWPIQNQYVLYSFCILYKISKFCLQSSFCWHISVFGSTKIEADFRHWCHSDILFLCFCMCYRIGESLLS